MKKTLLTVMLLAAIPALAQNFSVGVGIGASGYYPPAPCGPGSLWIDGYYDVNGYWVNGYCGVPPYGDAYWVAPGFYGGAWVGGYWAHRDYDRDAFRFPGFRAGDRDDERFRGGDRDDHGFRGGDRGDSRFRGGFSNGFGSPRVAPNNFSGGAPNNFRGGGQNFRGEGGGFQNFRGGGGGHVNGGGHGEHGGRR